MFYQMFDPVYWLFIGPTILLSLWASAKVKSTFGKYSKVRTARGMTGAEAARAMLDASGLSEVGVEQVKGMLTDHYDPRKKVLRLSPQVYQAPSVSAMGVACHEAGHALQHQANYFPLQIRSLLVPVAAFGSKAWIFVLMAGALMQTMGLIKLGIILFAGVVAFQLVTLPVEFDASARARRAMVQYGFVSQDEAQGASKVLSAAALTYVAAAATSIMTLLYYLFRFGLLGGRRS